MVTVARVRQGALALPEVEERPHFGTVAFYVRDKGFASLTEEEDWLRLRIPADQVDEAVADNPGARPFTRMGTTIGVELPRADLDVRVLDRFLRRAWEARAPKRLVAAHRPDAPARQASDLPAIGRPATNALAQHGITTLAQVAERSPAELQALHGVGPKAVRLLREALAATGRDLRAD